jgi:hypothetical protein
MSRLSFKMAAFHHGSDVNSCGYAGMVQTAEEESRYAAVSASLQCSVSRPEEIMTSIPILALALALAGCAASLPSPGQVFQAPSQTGLAADAPGQSAMQTGALVPTASNGSAPINGLPTGMDSGALTALPAQIVGFRASSVILYNSDTGSEGQKFVSRTLPLPLHVSRRSNSADRVEVITVEGPRWVATRDVLFASTSVANTSARP